LTREINESIAVTGSVSVLGSGIGSEEEVLRVRMKKSSNGSKRMRRREAILFVSFSYVIALFL